MSDSMREALAAASARESLEKQVQALQQEVARLRAIIIEFVPLSEQARKAMKGEID
jgi:hypothetical protein